MSSPWPKTLFIEKSQRPKGFTVLAPVTGEVYPLAQSSQPMIANGIIGEGVLLNLSGNKIVAPFDGVITELPATLHRFQIKAKSGIKVMVLMPQHTDKFHGQGFLPQVKAGQAVRMGQLIANFNPQKTQSLDNQECAVVVTNPELLGHIYSANKKVTAGEDVLLTITAKK